MGEALRESLAEPRSRFFVTMAAVLVALVFVGFAPTFYLKVFFTTRELHWIVQLHGFVLTIWCALFLAQNVLVTTRRTATHRRLGMDGVERGPPAEIELATAPGAKEITGHRAH